jgi:hypothetical protein
MNNDNKFIQQQYFAFVATKIARNVIIKKRINLYINRFYLLLYICA